MEIGSEFWKENKKHINDYDELFLSGRTALDAIIKDALMGFSIESVLLPSYCCHTVIEPFRRNNIQVRFYDVFVDMNGNICLDIPEAIQNEVFYAITYFGIPKIKYINNMPDFNSWILTIEDKTHSCFSSGYELEADYTYASYRKWFAIDGVAVARKKIGEFYNHSFWKENREYCKLRNQAFALKAEYMNGVQISKQCFLDKFNEAEKSLAINYVGCRPDMNSVMDFYEKFLSLDEFRKKRRDNADILIEKLKSLDGIQVLAEIQNSNTCPMFVPIIVPQHYRDALKNFLIEKEIYCPVHWPLSSMHKGISDNAKRIYGEELSLICDQRYCLDDMEREADAVRTFVKENIR